MVTYPLLSGVVDINSHVNYLKYARKRKERLGSLLSYCAG